MNWYHWNLEPYFSLMLSYCTIGKLFNSYLTLGSCIELNDDSTLSQSVGGAKYGLTIDLDAGLDTYAPFTVN